MKKINKFFNKFYWLRKFFLSKISHLFFSKQYRRKSIFKYIYKSNHWRDYEEPKVGEFGKWLGFRFKFNKSDK